VCQPCSNTELKLFEHENKMHKICMNELIGSCQFSGASLPRYKIRFCTQSSNPQSLIRFRDGQESRSYHEDRWFTHSLWCFKSRNFNGIFIPFTPIGSSAQAAPIKPTDKVFAVVFGVHSKLFCHRAKESFYIIWPWPLETSLTIERRAYKIFTS